MHPIYFDESGNTGLNLSDESQPVFVLCAMAVPADRWQAIERDLATARQAIYPDPVPDSFEMHGAEIHRGTEAMPDVLAWLQGQYRKKERPGAMPRERKKVRTTLVAD